MKRKIVAELEAWKKKKNRKPLILWGARQVGKTWTLKEFGASCYDDIVYISFYNNSRLASIFEKDYDIKRIIEALEIELHTRINEGTTLLVFDEVQNAPRVVESLKYFCEDAPGYHVAAAGSLLGVALHEGVSFPVGKVDEVYLYPMSFSEFLIALEEEKLASFIAERREDEINDFSDRYMDLLRQYCLVGGMPEVVESYRQNRDLREARMIQRTILSQYEGDFGKHVKPTELPRIRMVWNALPAQLSKENKKFFFGKIKKGARSKEYEIAIQWLKDAGLIRVVKKVSKPSVPLKAYEEQTAFKIFMNDIGLLGALSELEPESFTEEDLFVEFKGALAEQFVLQELICETSLTPYYYSSDKAHFEVDFLCQKEGGLLPIEVKAGENLRSKSLKVFCDKYKPKMAVRISAAKMRRQDWMINIPLWAVKLLENSCDSLNGQ